VGLVCRGRGGEGLTGRWNEVRQPGKRKGRDEFAWSREKKSWKFRWRQLPCHGTSLVKGGVGKPGGKNFLSVDRGV